MVTIADLVQFRLENDNEKSISTIDELFPSSLANDQGLAPAFEANPC